ncbi:MAG: pyridoxal phosphate-dependent aminotransferase [Vicinamibacteria bacterium]|jgi:aspartate aminotransferase|nr:pyridoxal phosphate-dependent aminotransferase [Vicinamibacteria bacterium]
MSVSKKVTEQIKEASWIRRMFEEGLRLKAERGAESVFDFTLGNPDLEPPEALIAALRRIVAENRPRSHAYMPNAGFPEVRAEIARRLRDRSGLGYSADHVLMTVGAAGAINVALKAMLDLGDEVIVLAPYFAEYRFYIENHGGRMVVVETDALCRPDIERIATALTDRTRALLINTPNNPSGVIYEAAFFQELEALLARRAPEAVVISDEPYRSLAFEGMLVPEIDSLVSRTLIANSWSKSLALPGERIGYLSVSPRVAEAAELMSACIFANRILGFVNAPAIWQLAIKEAGDAPIDARHYQEKCLRLYEALLSFGYEAIRPQGGFYVFLKTPLADEMAFLAMLKDEGVLAVPGIGFGRPGHIRLSVTVPSATIERALPAFQRALARARA